MNKRSMALVVFAIIMLLASWDSNRTNAAVVDGIIPQESIRLRILADSDSPLDQRIKRDVRDALVAQMNEWVAGPTTLEEARALVRDRMPELGEQVQKVLDAYGTDYSYTIELGQVPFPTKVYGGEVYPAGDYEALRVVLGTGEGQNWWCVLFPPLCFVDGVTGDAVSAKTANAKPATEQTSSSSRKSAAADKADHAKSAASDNAKKADSAKETDNADKSQKTEFRFFLWDWICSLFA